MPFEDFAEHYKRVVSGDIGSLALMRELELNKDTYFRYVREYKKTRFRMWKRPTHPSCQEGKIIPGLFASGEVANTGNFGHGVPSCGYSLGHALHFGRVAARSACERELL